MATPAAGTYYQLDGRSRFVLVQPISGDPATWPDILVCLRLSLAPPCFDPIAGCLTRCSICFHDIVFNPVLQFANVTKVCTLCAPLLIGD